MGFSYQTLFRRTLTAVAAIAVSLPLLPPPHHSPILTSAAPVDTGIGKVRWAYYVTYAADSLTSLRQNIGSLNYLSPYWYQIDGNGALSTGTKEVDEQNRATVVQLARSNNVRILPMIKNSATYEAFHPVLADPQVRTQAITRIVNVIVQNNYEGVNIDFEGVSPEDRPHLTAFMAELSPALRAQNKLVTQAVPAKDRERTTGWAGAYDYAALGPHNDLVIMMTYGYGTAVPQSTAPFPWVENSMAYAASQMPAEKLVLGLAWYGYDWNRTAGTMASVKYTDAMERARQYNATIEYNEGVQSPRFTYTANGEEHEVWYEDRRSNDAKMDLVFRYGLAGAAGWRIGHEEPAIWALFRDRLGFRTWYLAEGATAKPFDTWVLIQNPNPHPVSTTVTFMREDGYTLVLKREIAASTRDSIYVNQLLPNAAFSTKVEANGPVFVERAMYFGYDGHDSTGVNAPSRRWYLPEGSSKDGSDTWVLLMNPNAEAVNARVTFLRESGAPITKDFTVNPTSRLNVFANQHVPNAVFSTVVEADGPIVAERASYLDVGRSGHGSPGSPYLARRWYLPEGFTGHRVSLALMNPGSVPAQASLTLMLEGGENVRHTRSLPPRSRQTFVANDVLPANKAFSVLVESDQAIAAERTSLLPADSSGRTGSHASLGTLFPSRTWFLAEGSSGAPFHTFVLLQNPNSQPTEATVTFMTDGGKTVVQNYTLAPRSRFTVYSNLIVPNTAHSTRIDSTLPIVVERTMYFGAGAHASIGIGQ